MSDFSFLEAMHSWYEDRKETYQGPIPKIEYQTGKDVVAVGTFLATGGLATISKIKKGTDFVEGLVTTVKKSDFEKKLLTKEGKFIDNLLEIDYEKYLKRKTTQGKPPKDRTNLRISMTNLRKRVPKVRKRVQVLKYSIFTLKYLIFVSKNPPNQQIKKNFPIKPTNTTFALYYKKKQKIKT